MLSVKIVAFCLSAVQVVMISAPSIAACADVQTVTASPEPARLRATLSLARLSMS